MPRRVLSILLLAVIASMVAACSWLPGSARTASKVDDPFSGGYPTFRDEATGITAILGTPDLGVGTFRVAIALNDRSGLIRFPAVTLESVRPKSGASDLPAEVVNAGFSPFPNGIRGLYTASMTFDRPGTWTINVLVARPDGRNGRIALSVAIAERASAPVVGAAAPKSKNRTAKDIPSLDRLTSGSTPDPALYQRRIADSIEARRPVVAIFTSPAFCTTPLCGPQVEEASELVKQYGDRVDFVHIDLFENPREIKGDLKQAKRSPLLKDWGLHTDQWTFIIDANGIVAGRFEAFVPRAELEASINGALGVPRR